MALCMQDAARRGCDIWSCGSHIVSLQWDVIHVMKAAERRSGRRLGLGDITEPLLYPWIIHPWEYPRFRHLAGYLVLILKHPN